MKSGQYDVVDLLGRSLPVRGAWIEIVPLTASAISAIVAPRKGSVD